MPQISSDRARLYRTLRTAHLEQIRALAPATVLYQARRYDFDESAAQGLDLVMTTSLRCAVLLLRSRVSWLEINEPLMRYGIRGASLALAALALRTTFGVPRPTIVTYAIENLDPFTIATRPGPRATVSRYIDRMLTRLVWKRVDRIVYGTEDSRRTYQKGLPARASLLEILIPTLPERCVLDAGPKDLNRVVFLGAFSERKGFSLMVSAWTLVSRGKPERRLVILGKGDLEPQARLFAKCNDSVSLIIDPTRAEIHRQLRGSQVLVLPSQPASHWREQVGLPITEALAHGCSIVSTSETGLSSWLVEHGHSVIPSGGDAATLARAIEFQIQLGRPPEEVLTSLPARDGRLAADDWLFASL